MQTDGPGMGVGVDWARLIADVKELDDVAEAGRVLRVVGLTVETAGPRAAVGELCHIQRSQGPPLLAKVVGFQSDRLLLSPMGDLDGVGPGDRVVPQRQAMTVPAGDGLIGRVLNAAGEPVDGRGPLPPMARVPVWQDPPPPLARRRIEKPLPVGVRAIDALITCGLGQRVGLFAGSGVGKSTLLGMMARYAEVDVVCIALVGERGREVREFLERDLGEGGLARSVVVVATSDRPPLERLTAALVATSIAEYFRDQGMNVLLLMDSLTRFAAAQREIGLAAGEPPATRGYPPSVFSLLPRLLERTGPGPEGTITAFYTVLVEGDDMNEPVADAARSILDGHVVLSRELAQANHYPAIDVLASVSRVMPDVVSADQLAAAARLRTLMARYRESLDLIRIGAYVAGSDPTVDRAIASWPAIEAFLRQETGEWSSFADTLSALEALVPVEEMAR